MILILDNYDSFTYNLYQLVGQLEKDIVVKRNDKITIDEIRELQPDSIIISPGPGNPTNKKDFGVCGDVIEEFKGRIPILGVCLGHQGIFATFGGKIKRAEPIHGKLSEISHSNEGIFKNVENTLVATRYHSLICDEDSTPDCIEVIAKTEDGTIMAIKHSDCPVFGLQFHPESIGTASGVKIIKNFLEVEGTCSPKTPKTRFLEDCT
ncbi:anthranilate synthase component II [Methanobacterium sp. MBAC-LM]|uniref:anthranilate synthase component II n=1 Tax=Methanobacterium sp. MBAC-LM TaxID=3412034 RepID=UPI003C7515AE